MPSNPSLFFVFVFQSSLPSEAIYEKEKSRVTVSDKQISASFSIYTKFNDKQVLLLFPSGPSN